jgi:hypothetical protein
MKLILVIFSLIFSHSVSASCFNLSVEIDNRKPNGDAWDIGDGAPDVKVCFEDGWGYRCKVRTISPKEYEPWCKNTYNCDLGLVYFSSDKVNIEVIDVDKIDDDPIDFENCTVGKLCEMGSAKVEFISATCPK